MCGWLRPYSIPSNQDVRSGAAALAGDRRFVHPREYVDGATGWDPDLEGRGDGTCICKGANPVGPPGRTGLRI